MFDLENQMTAWRQQMRRAGVKTPASLDELENHLREQTTHLIQTGATAEQAFQTAVSRLGDANRLQREFNKQRHFRPAPIPAISAVWSVAMIALVASLFQKLLAGRMSALLMAHIVTLSGGYIAALAMAGVGFYFVWSQWTMQLSSAREQSLKRAVWWFNTLAISLVAAGLFLGMLWSYRTCGHYLGLDPQEIGAMAVFIWLLVILATRNFLKLRHVMLIGIGGNMLVVLAWFGSRIIAASQGAYGWADHLILETALVVHLVFFLIGAAPVNFNHLKNPDSYV